MRATGRRVGLLRGCMGATGRPGGSMLNSKDGSGQPSWSSASWRPQVPLAQARPARAVHPHRGQCRLSALALWLAGQHSGRLWTARLGKRPSCTCSSFPQRQIVAAREPKGQTPNSRIAELAAGNDTAQADAGTPLRRGAVEGQGEEPVLGPAAPGATTVRGRRKTLHVSRVAIGRVRRDPPRAVAAVWCFVPGPSPEPLAEPLFAG
jgi:hypothetical protein